MKKIVSLILAVVMICSLSVVTFANPLEGSYEIVGKASTSEVKAGDTFTYTLNFLEGGNDLTMGCFGALWTIGLNYDSSAFELVGNPAVTNYDFTFDSSNSVSSDGYYKAVVKGHEDGDNTTRTFTDGTPLITFTFTVKADATAGVKEFSFNDSEAEIFDCDDFAYLTLGENLTDNTASVTVKGDDPDPVTNVTADKNAGAEVTLGENKYTGIYTYSLETNVTSFNLVATYNEGLTKNLKYAGSEAIELNNVAIKGGDATITFKIAIVGVPADVTISGLAIQAIQ